jgi:quercetin dioxygenase-like cupin family protein
MERLRPHPEDRLAAPVQVVDLAAVAAGLRAERHASVAGHRQIAVMRHGPVTIILLVFDEGGLLKEHRAEGVVTIHVLSGRLQVVVDEEVREMASGELMALAPGLAHSVRALAPSELLLTVHRLPVDEGTPDIQNFSGAQTYSWQNTGAAATVNQSASITAGGATLTLRDANGLLVYNRSLADNGTFSSTAGAADT